MKNKKQLLTELVTNGDLKYLIEAYEEIAAMRMRKVKKSVLMNRDFFSGLNDIYHRVIFTYRVSKHHRFGKHEKNWLPLASNGKTVSVLISSNTGLYGDVIKRTFDLFRKNILGVTTDLAIIGKVGRQLFDLELSRIAVNRPYTYFQMSDNGVDNDRIREIVEHLLQYTNIVVYHSIYISILSQQPTETFVTGKAMEMSSKGPTEELKCIIEPSVEEVAEFFEKQIVASIFEQTVYEASLSKFASRMMSLDFANENITASLHKGNFARLKLKHTSDSISQLERLAGLKIWINK